MEVFMENIIGGWHKEKTPIIYRFYKSGNLIIQGEDKQVAVDFSIITKERRSVLMIDNKKFPFIIMNPGVSVPYFAISTKSGIVTFYKMSNDE